MCLTLMMNYPGRDLLGTEGGLVDISKIAEKLDAEEKLVLKYRFPVRKEDGQVEYEVRTGMLLDVAEEERILYVSHEGQVIWIRYEEALEVEAAVNAR